jgi:lipoprotein signal peptidase
VWFIPLLLMPIIDQGVKHLLRRRLGSRSVPLGPLVTLRIVSARVWLTRGAGHPALPMMWLLWVLAACALAILAAVLPSTRLFVALLVGGSLSHAVETSWRGSVTDYICSRWWPAFNLADVAMTIGALGVVLHASIAVHNALV